MTVAVRRVTGKSVLAAVVLAGLVSTGTSTGAPLPDGGAKAGGGSGGAAGLLDQNTALDGRQNNACGDSQRLTGSGILGGSGRIGTHCTTSARSHSVDALTTGDGAEATGGDGVALQQNIAERGRQNNACGNSIESGLYDGETDTHCTARDHSVSKETVTHAGAAQASGGDGALYQQNIAQQGRQNNACGNTNVGSVSGEAQAHCTTHDGSVSKGTVTRGGGAEATGGNSTVELTQQNIAQEGRQNNACGNTNALTLDDGQTNARCSAIDESVEIRSKNHG